MSVKIGSKETVSKVAVVVTGVLVATILIWAFKAWVVPRLPKL